MPSRPLPDTPSLEHLRKEAKRLCASVRAGDRDALSRVAEFHPHPIEALGRFALADAQLATARGYGFSSWAKLKQHVVAIEPFVWNPPPVDPASPAAVFARLACLTYSGVHPSPARARRMLADHRDLATASLSTAVAAGDVATVAAMLDGEPGLINRKGGPLLWEPLLYACYSRLDATAAGHSTLEVARVLLSRGADPNAGFLYAGRYAFTALTGAFGRGEDWPNQPPHPEWQALARLLLDAGADPNDSQALYNRHFMPDDDHLRLLFAYGLGREKGGPWLARQGDPLLTPARLLVVELCAAARHGLGERIELLVQQGVDVNGRSPRTGRTAYEEALRAGHPQIAEYLVEHGAARSDLDALETFALACISGREAEVQSRLAADPTLLERLGHHGRIDMLHRAVEARQFDGLRLIVRLGVDINGMVPGTGMDRTVLHNAAGWGRVDVVRTLIELGADPNRADLTYDATPIGWALYNRNEQEVVDCLLPFATIFDAVRAGAVERVDDMLRRDPALARARDPGGTPLVFSVHPQVHRLDEMLRVLVRHGVDLDARDARGRTLLAGAQALELTEFADTLRAHGARGDAREPA